METIINILSNKKSIAILLAAGIVLLGIILFAGRGGSGAGAGQTPTEGSMAGHYEIESIEGSTGSELLEQVQSQGMSITIDVEEDGKATMDALGQQINVIYDLKTMTADIDGTKAPFEYEGSKLTIEYNGTTMVFTKVKS